MTATATPAPITATITPQDLKAMMQADAHQKWLESTGQMSDLFAAALATAPA